MEYSDLIVLKNVQITEEERVECLRYVQSNTAQAVDAAARIVAPQALRERALKIHPEVKRQGDDFEILFDPHTQQVLAAFHVKRELADVPMSSLDEPAIMPPQHSALVTAAQVQPSREVVVVDSNQPLSPKPQRQTALLYGVAGFLLGVFVGSRLSDRKHAPKYRLRRRAPHRRPAVL